jgi:hypothetical protein
LGAGPLGALPGQYARLVAVGNPLVLAEEIADLALTDPDVARGHICVFPQVAVQLGHKALAEPHHRSLAATSRVEIGTALGAADRHARQRVLDGLLKPKELGTLPP